MYVVWFVTRCTKTRRYPLATFRTRHDAIERLLCDGDLCHVDFDDEFDAVDACDFAGRTYSIERAGPADVVGTTMWVLERHL